MQLLQVRIVSAGPLSDLVFDLTRGDGRPRPCTCIFGGPGTGKTTLVLALASTRPGCAVALPRSSGGAPRATGAHSWAVADWSAGDDDPSRPHPLRIVSPGVVLESESEESAIVRRREQGLFDRKAAEGGFVFVALPGSRWFGRSPVLLSAPDRVLGRHEARASSSFDDGTRADLARDIKQTLAYAAIGGALSLRSGQSARPAALFEALKDALAELAPVTGHAFEGCDPVTLEPIFCPSSGPSAHAGRPLPRIFFDDLPAGARHAIAFVTLPIRAAYAAYPERSPRDAEVVVAIDDAELHLPPTIQRALAGALRRALPRAQWILTTSSPQLAAGVEPDEIVTLRRIDPESGVELFTGPLALVH